LKVPNVTVRLFVRLNASPNVTVMADVLTVKPPRVFPADVIVLVPITVRVPV
jgi:hypothetical protein